jgi:hypothetical protein
MAALADDVRTDDVLTTLRRLAAAERGEPVWPKLRNGELLSAQLLGKARVLEAEAAELVRLRQRAIDRKDADEDRRLKGSWKKVFQRLAHAHITHTRGQVVCFHEFKILLVFFDMMAS